MGKMVGPASLGGAGVAEGLSYATAIQTLAPDANPEQVPNISRGRLVEITSIALDTCEALEKRGLLKHEINEFQNAFQRLWWAKK